MCTTSRRTTNAKRNISSEMLRDLKKKKGLHRRIIPNLKLIIQLLRYNLQSTPLSDPPPEGRKTKGNREREIETGM